MAFIFEPKHIELIRAGNKTQTRRVLHPGELVLLNGKKIPWQGLAQGMVVQAIYHPSKRLKHRVGSDYAVKPGRTAKGDRDLRIEVITMRIEMLKYISKADAIAEGVSAAAKDPVFVYSQVWDDIPRPALEMWRNNPWVIVYEFKPIYVAALAKSA